MGARAVKRAGERLLHAFAVRRTVAIEDCVHFCAYRYGRGETNPYEQYAIGLAAGEPPEDVRARFVAYLQHFRPQDLGEALGVDLSRAYPLWALPWRTPRQVSRNAGWHESARAVVDVMTYFSAAGIPDSVLKREYHWHESAFETMSRMGYRPEDFTYITARELRGDRPAYLVTDGNHRLSALSALGHRTVEIKLPLATTIHRAKVDRWPLVRSGMMGREDALRVFDAYVEGHRVPARTQTPASIV
jgi:hypothetical protein